MRRATFPSLFTAGNLVCGFLAVYFVAHGRFSAAAWLIILAGCLDLFDGMLARFTGGESKFGIEFDSLADVCSFGLAPAVLMVELQWGGWGIGVGALFFAAGAIRLARFNIRQVGFEKTNFTGLPIPISAIVLASYVLFVQGVWRGLDEVELSVPLALALAALMVSSFEYISCPKFRFGSALQRLESGALALLIAGLALFPHEGIFPATLVYVASGPFRWVMGLWRERGAVSVSAE